MELKTGGALTRVRLYFLHTDSESYADNVIAYSVKDLILPELWK